MFSRLMWVLGIAATVTAGVVLQPAGPAQAAGDFFMTGTYEMHNGFSTRRRIVGFDPSVVTTAGTGMGAVDIDPSAFSISGTPNKGAAFIKQVCPTGDIVCILSAGAVGFQPFPGFPVFAQVASTFTEKNASTGMLGAGGGPGAFDFCPLLGNANNGTAFPWACPGLGFGSPTGIQGLVTYSGGGGYGGTMAILRSATVTVSQRRNIGPDRYQHDQDSRTGFWPVGVPMSYTYTSSPAPGPLTQSPVLGSFSSIQTIGPVVGPGAAVVASLSTGFPWTTGMVRGVEDSCVQAGTCPTPFNPNNFVQFTVTGSDARGPDGQGNLSLVSGGIFQNRDTLTTVNFGTLDLTLALPEPGTALGLGAGVMLLMGLARRRA